jgi:hypothetical protein
VGADAGFAAWYPTLTRPGTRPEESAGRTTEEAIVAEVRAILASGALAQIRAARAAGHGAAVQVGRRRIQYEPALPASGMTMFGQDGFVIGREAFASEAELVKTLLHELYRLATSSAGRGVIPQQATSMQKVVAGETKAAADFAERAYRAFFSGRK